MAWRYFILYILFALALAPVLANARPVRLEGHAQPRELRQLRHLGRTQGQTRLQLAVALRPRDLEGLEALVRRIQDPADPEYKHYLTTAEFLERFAPAQEDVNRVVAYLRANGLRPKAVHGNRLVIDVEASAQAVERAFQLELHEYQGAEGRRVRAPSQDPSLSDEVAGKMSGITGLGTVARWRPHRLRARKLDPHAGGATFAGLLTPAKMQGAYGLSSSATAGSGETLALFELDGFKQSDIDAYALQFSLPNTPIDTILVGGATGAAGDDTLEVALDIELAMAVSPGLSKIQVYEGPNTDSGVIDTYSRIASDNVAKVVSTSWGSPESQNTAAFLNAENAIFLQMAAQGQSVFAAAGDSGAYDDSSAPTTLTVDDPASQPAVTAVGGTSLSQVAGSYGSETSWASAAQQVGGGGGVSAYWSIPSWQSGLALAANKGSHSRRMVPDVAVNADPDKGYAVYAQGSWYAVGGTSAAAPVWAAFFAQVNQARVAAGLARVGFANPALYQLAQSSLYASCFHDVADNSNNLYFPAVAGYDLATGWGSFRAGALLSALSAATLPPYAPSTVSTNGTGGGSVIVSWSAAGGATSYAVYRSLSAAGPFVSVGTTAATSFTDATAGAVPYYYYVVASNGAGSSGPSAKRAGASNLAAPGAATALDAKGAE